MAHSHTPSMLGHSTPSADLHQVQLSRDLYWQNVIREMLTGLSMMQGQPAEMFDGRFAVLTKGGERIPIAEVAPMFACALTSTAEERTFSIAVECTVFRICTPSGEVFTLPLHEIRGLHALSPELVRQLEQESIERMSGESPSGAPFGLAAYTKPTPAPSVSPGPPGPPTA